MSTKLIDLQAGVLLNEFGKGEHKPGSGSAAAFQGMLSAEMTKTVIKVTLSKKSYASIHEDFNILLKEIEEKTYPVLERLLQEDNDQFHKVFKARTARDKEQSPIRKIEFANLALKELMPSTEVLIEIATKGLRLAECAVFVFDKGAHWVRGDSSVAIQAALSCISGCIAIIDLNLTSFTNMAWTEKTKAITKDLRNRYEALSIESKTRQKTLEDEVTMQTIRHF